MSAVVTRNRVWFAAAGFLLAAGAAAAALDLPRGVAVTVVNHGPGALRCVEVLVTGQVVHVGKLPEGHSRTVRVNPTGESTVFIEYTGLSGKTRRLTADCYLEPGYAGTIKVGLRDGTIELPDEDVRLRAY